MGISIAGEFCTRLPGSKLYYLPISDIHFHLEDEKSSFKIYVTFQQCKNALTVV